MTWNGDGLPTISDVFREREADWRQDAACVGCDPDLWFPPVGKTGCVGSDVAREAKLVCATCPVLTECAVYALRTRQKHGVWGGMSPKELRRARGQLAGYLEEDVA